MGTVHALAETWRVLRVAGQLIDLRPLTSGWLVEVVGEDEATLAGRLDDTPRVGHNIASDKAVAEAVERGWFKKGSREFFQYNYYWDTVEEMREYIEVNWSSAAVLPDPVRAEVSRLAQLYLGSEQIRVQRTMLLASYRKLATPIETDLMAFNIFTRPTSV